MPTHWKKYLRNEWIVKNWPKGLSTECQNRKQLSPCWLRGIKQLCKPCFTYKKMLKKYASHKIQTN